VLCWPGHLAFKFANECLLWVISDSLLAM
jgi:hypothetical protein